MVRCTPAHFQNFPAIVEGLGMSLLLFLPALVLLGAVLSETERQRLLGLVKQYGIRAVGRPEYVRFLKGEYLTRQELIDAECYSCMGFYADGRGDCENPACPLYRRHAYRNKPVTDRKNPRTGTDEEGDDV